MDPLESDAVRARYERRRNSVEPDRYSLLKPDVWQTIQERQRAILRLFADRLFGRELSTVTLTEVGCGNGGNLLELLRAGFSPELLSGLELLPERVAAARHVLPSALRVFEGDALEAPVAPTSQDVVFQSVVFSSLLDDAFQLRLAERMWSWVRPGGGVLWYDFIYDNPANRDVRGVPVKRVRELFPQAQITVRRVTLAPPIARRVCKLHPGAYGLFNLLPLLRSHVLVWVAKAPT